MKKILSLLALMMLTMTSAWAGTATFNLGENNGVSTPEGFFKSVGEKWNWNTKFNGAEYDGISFSKGLKMEGSTKIGFTTEYPSTVTIVQSTWSAATITLDGADLVVDDATAGTGCRIYTIENVEAGDHTIGRGSGESGLFYVKVEWTDSYTATFENTGNWAEVYAYAWVGEVKPFGEWPGTQLTADGTGLFPVSITGTKPEKIIFHNNAGVQTDDLDFKDGGVYNASGRVITLTTYSATFKTDGMTSVWAYVWNDNEKALGEWPGTQMTPDNDNTWKIEITTEDAPKYIIFHDNAGNQTPDWAFEDGKAYEYMLKDYAVTFKTDAGWGSVKAYAWSGEGDKVKEFLGTWPGEAMIPANEINNGFGISFKAFDAPEQIIFNNGDGEQTANLPFINEKAYKWITATPYYALKEGDTFKAGTTVDLGDATITYGVEGGADFGAARAVTNEDYAGFTYMTDGNGENGTVDGGTVYTIVPKYDGTITIGVRLNGGKAMHINEDGTDLADYAGIKIANAANTTFDFAVKAGSTYKIWCDGSKLGFFGFDYKFTQPEVSITAVALMGSSNEWAEPLATFEPAAEAASTGYWTLSDVEFAANDEFKVYVSYSDGTEKWLAPASNDKFLVNEEQLKNELDLLENTGNMYVEKAAKLSFSLNPGLDKLTITGQFEGQPVENTYTVYFENTGNWAKVFAYAWYAASGDETGLAQILGTWPGTEMTPDAETGKLSITFTSSVEPTGIIFNNGEEGDGKIQTADLEFENGKTYSYELPAEDIILTLSEGDIAAALADAKAKVAKVGDITINLDGESNAVFSLGSTLTAPNNITINGNDHMIQVADEMTDPFITLDGTETFAMKSETEASDHKFISYVTVLGVKVVGLKNAIIKDNQKTYVETVELSWDNIELAAGKVAFDFSGKGYIGNLNVQNSTIWGKEGTGFFAQYGSRPKNINADWYQTFNIHNNTFVNIANGKNMCDLKQNGTSTNQYFITNNIFVNCGKKNQVIVGFNKGQTSSTPEWRVSGNYFEWGDACVNADEITTAGQKDGVDIVQNCVDGKLTFVDAANGDFNGEIQLAEDAVYPAAIPGAPMWTINIKLAPVAPGFYLVGYMNNWTPISKYMMAPNDAAQPEAPEYMIKLDDVEAGTEFKVVGVDEEQNLTWYPDQAGNCTINDAGNYNIFFRPDYNGGDGWYAGCIFVQPVYEQIIANGAYYVADQANDPLHFITDDGKLMCDGVPFEVTFDETTGTYGVQSNSIIGHYPLTIEEDAVYGHNISTTQNGVKVYLTANAMGTGVTFGTEPYAWALLPKEYVESDILSYTVAGTEDLTGSEWALVDANKMTKNAETGLFEIKYEGIVVTNEAKPEFKVVTRQYEDGIVVEGTEVWYPENNWVITPDYLGAEGKYTITITFNTTTKEIGVSGVKTGEATGINGIYAEKLNNATIYNLNGQRIQNAQKGLYIINGRKVVVK